MSVKKIRNLIIILIIIALFLIVAIIVIKKFNKKDIIEEETSPYEEYEPTKVDIALQDINIYLKLRSSLSTLMTYKNAGNETAMKEITGDTSSFSEIEKSDEPIMLDVVYRTGDTLNNINFVKFKYYKQQENYYAVVVLDRENEAYMIIQSNSNEYENAKKGTIDNKYNKKISIEQKKYNKFTDIKQSRDEDIIKEYFKDYIQKALYYPEDAYNSLNNEYKEKRFGSYEKFQIYLQTKREELLSLDIYSIKKAKDFETAEEYADYMQKLEIKGLNKYQVKIHEGYKQYTVIDDYGNYYIFNVKGAMQYELYLDNYTIPENDFIEKYNASTNEEKVALNVSKFLNAIHNQNYDYSYSKLSDDFKNNYLKTVDIFETYAKNSLDIYENIESVDVIEKNELYICTVKTKDGKSKGFIMKLEDGTDFVMSFEI